MDIDISLYQQQQTIMTECDDSTHSTSSKSTPPLNAGELQQLLQTLDDDDELVNYYNYNNEYFNNCAYSFTNLELIHTLAALS